MSERELTENPLRETARRLSTLEGTLREWLDEKKVEFAKLVEEANEAIDAGEIHSGLNKAIRLGEMATTIGRLEKALGIDGH